MREIGIVQSTDSKKTIVRLNRKAACENCNLCGLKKREKFIDIDIDNNIDAKVGEHVVVEMKTVNVAKAAAVVYVLPLVIGGIGFVTATALKMTEVMQMVLSFSGLAIGVLAIVGIDKIFKKKQIMPVILRIADDDDIQRI